MKKAAWGILLLVGLSGCASIGPSTIARDRFDYITAISDSGKSQMLLNLVQDTAATSAAAAAAASAYYRPPVYVATPPPPPTVIVTPPAAPPPPTARVQPNVGGARLKELKSMLNQGLITQSQYQEESQKILNQLAE